MAETGVGNYEETIAELDQLVTRMEQGNLSLEDALASFERGILLTRQCQQALQQAELKIQMLINPDSQPPEVAPLPDVTGNGDATSR